MPGPVCIRLSRWLSGKESACQWRRSWRYGFSQSRGWEDALEEEMATHSSILAGKSHGQRSLTGYNPRACKESNTTEWLSMHMYMYLFVFMEPASCWRPEVGKLHLQSAGQIWPAAAYFLLVKCYWSAVTLMHLCSIFNCFCASTWEWMVVMEHSGPQSLNYITFFPLFLN